MKKFFYIMLTIWLYLITDALYTEHIVRPNIEHRIEVNDMRDVHLMATIQRFNEKAMLYHLEPIDFDERYYTERR